MADQNGIKDVSTLEVFNLAGVIPAFSQRSNVAGRTMEPNGKPRHGNPFRPGGLRHSPELLELLAGPEVSDRDLLICLLSGGGRRDVAYESVDRLLAHFATFASVIAASPADLAFVGGLARVEVLALKAAQMAALRIVRARIDERPILGNMESVREYLVAALAAQRSEEFRVLFLDSANHLIADETIARGTLNWVAAKAREVMLRTLRWHATALILAHNHPSAFPSPSGSDILATKWIIDAVSLIDVVVHDHIIVSESGVFSLKEAGLLPRANIEHQKLVY